MKWVLLRNEKINFLRLQNLVILKKYVFRTLEAAQVLRIGYNPIAVGHEIQKLHP